MYKTLILFVFVLFTINALSQEDKVDTTYYNYSLTDINFKLNKSNDLDCNKYSENRIRVINMVILKKHKIILISTLNNDTIYATKYLIKFKNENGKTTTFSIISSVNNLIKADTFKMYNCSCKKKNQKFLKISFENLFMKDSIQNETVDFIDVFLVELK